MFTEHSRIGIFASIRVSYNYVTYYYSVKYYNNTNYLLIIIIIIKCVRKLNPERMFSLENTKQ